MERYESTRGRGRRRKEENGGNRVCHDCGKRTSDYRCPACLDEWRKKHGVAVRTRES